MMMLLVLQRGGIQTEFHAGLRAGYAAAAAASGVAPDQVGLSMLEVSRLVLSLAGGGLAEAELLAIFERFAPRSVVFMCARVGCPRGRNAASSQPVPLIQGRSGCADA